MRIALVFNLKRLSPEVTDVEAELDSPTTIRGIRGHLEDLGHRVRLIEADERAYGRLRRARRDIDLVFNIAEGTRGEAREAQIPCSLEMLGIPYTGAGPLCLALTLDKAKTKEVLRARGIATPPWQLFEDAAEPLRRGLRFPLIVKPNAEGSSIGIDDDAIVHDRRELRARVAWVVSRYRQPALAEAFLDGDEYSVALLASGAGVEVLPLMRLDFSCLPAGLRHPIDSYHSKHVGVPAAFIVCPAPVPAPLGRRIRETALAAYEAVGCRDFTRVDLRCDGEGRPSVLEINALPAIDPDLGVMSGYPLAVAAAGLTYGQMLERIIDSAMRRARRSRHGARPGSRRVAH